MLGPADAAALRAGRRVGERLVEALAQEVDLAVEQPLPVGHGRGRSDLLPEPGEECLEVGVRVELGERRWIGHHVVERLPRRQSAAHRVLLALDVVQLEQGGGVAEGGVGLVLLGEQAGEHADVAAEALVAGGRAASATICGGCSWP